jgi:hypothetical protein
MIDCCHSGYAVGLRSVGEDEARGRARTFLSRASSSFENVRGRIVLAACAGDQLARELPQFQHGAFTYYVLQQWRSNPDEVDVELLFRGIDQGLQSLGLPRPVKGGVQEGRIVLREENPRYLEQRQRLYTTINGFDTEQLESFLFTLGVDYDVRSGDSRGAKIRSLIVSADRAGRLNHLEKALQRQIEVATRDQAAQEEDKRTSRERAIWEAAESLTRKKVQQEEAARLARERAAREEAARLAREREAQLDVGALY